MTDIEKLREELTRHRADLAEVQRTREILDRRERALSKVVSGIEELIADIQRPSATQEPLLSDVTPAPMPPEPEVTLNDAVFDALKRVGPLGATPEELWQMASSRGAKTSIEPLRAISFTIANLRKRNIGITKMPDGRFRLSMFV